MYQQGYVRLPFFGMWLMSQVLPTVACAMFPAHRAFRTRLPHNTSTTETCAAQKWTAVRGPCQDLVSLIRTGDVDCRGRPGSGAAGTRDNSCAQVPAHLDTLRVLTIHMRFIFAVAVTFRAW